MFFPVPLKGHIHTLAYIFAIPNSQIRLFAFCSVQPILGYLWESLPICCFMLILSCSKKPQDDTKGLLKSYIDILSHTVGVPLQTRADQTKPCRPRNSPNKSGTNLLRSTSQGEPSHPSQSNGNTMVLQNT